MDLQEIRKWMRENNVQVYIDAQQRPRIKDPDKKLTADIREHFTVHRPALILLADNKCPKCEGDLTVTADYRYCGARGPGHYCETLTLSEFAESKHLMIVPSELVGEEVIFAANNAKYDQFPGQSTVVYTADELRFINGMSEAAIQTIHHFKKVFGGTVQQAYLRKEAV